MNSPAIDIKDVLVAGGTGTFGTPNSNIHISKMPDTPDLCMSVYDTGGFTPEVNYQYERPTIQIQVRGAVGGYVDAYARAVSIRSLLHGLHNESWGVSWYIGIWAMGDILFLGYDERDRPLLSLNFRIHRTGQREEGGN